MSFIRLAVQIPCVNQESSCRGVTTNDGWMGRQMDGWVGRWMDGWVDGWMDEWMAGQMGGWVDESVSGCKTAI